MTVILNTRGVLAQRTILPLTAQQMTWFIDPEHCLRHLADLSHVKVAAYCQRCYALGMDDAVSATFNSSTRSWTVRCACSDYPPIVDQGDGQVLAVKQPQDDGTVKTHALYSVDELFQKLGWSFKCAAECARLGMQDGIEGSNDARAQVLTVSCGCTIRAYQDTSKPVGN